MMQLFCHFGAHILFHITFETTGYANLLVLLVCLQKNLLY